MPQLKPHTLQWFINRVCRNVDASGLVVSNQQHAGYLYDVQNEMGSRYADKPVVQP